MEKGGATANEAIPSNLGGAAPSKHDDLTQAPKWTSDPSGRVSLLLGDNGPASWKPITVNELFQRTASEMGSAMAIAVKRDGVWRKWTWAEYYSQTRAVAKSFIKLGLQPFHGVGVLGFNSPEWFMAYLAAMLAGGVGVGIYTTNSAAACHHVLEDCKANIVVVENIRQLEKILEVRSRLPHLKAIVQYLGRFSEKPEGNCLTWPDLLVYGHDIPDSDLQHRIDAQQPNNCCSIVYTSGTTGLPKGVLLSHDNVTWTARSGVESVRQSKGTEVCVSYLPLSHVAPQMMDLYGPLHIGVETWFAQPDALKGSLANTLKEVRPTYFMGVPRVWEKIADRVQVRARMFGFVKSKLFSWARGKALKGNLSKERGGSVPFGYSVANSLLLGKARAEMGLDRCRYCFTGAAPISCETAEFFLSVGLPLLEIYGMSECSGPATMARPWLRRTGSSGCAYDGVELKLHNMDSDGNGELCFRGRHVFMGYQGMEKQTSETLDEERWLHSGDIGKIDMDGFVTVTGRLKELIVTSGGENVPPVLVEDKIKAELPIISHAFLVGDRRNYLTCLLTLKVEMDNETNVPTDRLNEIALQECVKVGSQSRTVLDIVDNGDKLVMKMIQEGMDRANEQAVSRAQKVQKWSLLREDFSIEGGELGPTMKMKRQVVLEKYKQVIDQLYR